MTASSTSKIHHEHCRPCEGGFPPLNPTQIQEFLRAVPHWNLSSDGKRIQRQWIAKDFLTAVNFFDRVGKIAEAEDHHPDLHLTDYCQVSVEIWTHAVQGLTENDFILASKIDHLPLELKI